MEQGYILDFGAMWFSAWGVLVSYNKLPNPTPRTPALDRPLCPKCAQLMWLARIEPDKPDHDRRTFECGECDHIETVVVKYR
jgi:hypothetical protein